VLLFKELCYKTVGAAQEVHRTLGPGFLESVYEHALAQEFALRQIPFERQAPLSVMYKQTCVGDFRADFVVDGKIILEIKATTGLVPAHEAQALHYLAMTGFRLALLINFGTKSLQFKRIIR
jgi:GxxExxY protein